jgi:hypothetical protein
VLTAGKPRLVSEGPYEGVTLGITPDGQRLLMIQPVEHARERAVQIQVVLNWHEELRRLVPVD